LIVFLTLVDIAMAPPLHRARQRRWHEHWVKALCAMAKSSGVSWQIGVHRDFDWTVPRGS
jgi:hypothetical protein